MAVVTGLQSATTTPATTFHGNGTGTGVLDTALLGAGWVFIELTTGATQGVTGDVYVWRNGASTFVLGLEVDNSTNGGRIKFWAAETWNAVTKKFNQPVDGHNSNTAMTPTANYTVIDTENTLAGHALNAGAVSIPTTTAGFFYLYRVDANLLTFGTYSAQSTTDDKRSRWVQAGHFTPLYTAYPDVHPLMLHTLPSAVVGQISSWSLTSGASSSSSNIRLSRSPGNTFSVAGAFTAHSDFIIPTKFQNTTAPLDTTYVVFGAGGIAPLGHIGPICGQAFVHGDSSGVAHGQSFMRGYIPNTIRLHSLTISAATIGTEPHLGSTITVDGDQYYLLGGNIEYGSSGFAGSFGVLSGVVAPTIAIKAT